MRKDDEEDDGMWPSWSETDDVGKGVYIGAAIMAILVIWQAGYTFFGT